jgi:sigma-E factor negative regulatory protein RseB
VKSLAVRWWRLLLVVFATWLVHGGVSAQTVQPGPNLADWLMRVHQATQQKTYTGTFVVSTGSTLSSARIWHVCEATEQVERVEVLSGVPRATYRRNTQVVTFFPASKRVVMEDRARSTIFPNLGRSPDASIANHYQFSVLGSERIAGFDADVVDLKPKDSLRYGLRGWTDKKSGLVLQLKTLDHDGHTLEQAAFSDLQLDAPIDSTAMLQAMARTEGYRVEHAELHTTSADAQGWSLRSEVPGFRSVGCYQRPTMTGEVTRQSEGRTMQWVFSDGLATVSVFVEAFDAQRHGREGIRALGGASHAMAKRIDAWWATAVGEVPTTTLGIFLQELERKK